MFTLPFVFAFQSTGPYENTRIQEGPEVQENFERGMKALFQVPKADIVQLTPQAAPFRSGGKEGHRPPNFDSNHVTNACAARPRLDLSDFLIVFDVTRVRHNDAALEAISGISRKTSEFLIGTVGISPEKMSAASYDALREAQAHTRREIT